MSIAIPGAPIGCIGQTLENAPVPQSWVCISEFHHPFSPEEMPAIFQVIGYNYGKFYPAHLAIQGKKPKFYLPYLGEPRVVTPRAVTLSERLSGRTTQRQPLPEGLIAIKYLMKV